LGLALAAQHAPGVAVANAAFLRGPDESGAFLVAASALFWLAHLAE
jgi:hypothetical protein